MNPMQTIIFHAAGTPEIYQRLLATGKYCEGNLHCKTFGDGEIYHRINTPVKHREVVVVGDMSSNAAILASYDVCNAVFDETALGLTLLMPKQGLSEDPFRQRCLSTLFQSIPRTPRGNRLVIVDAGSQGVPHYENLHFSGVLSHTADPAFELFGIDSKPVILHTSSYGYLAREMMKHGDFELGAWETEQLDGRPFFKALKTDLKGRIVVIVSGTIDDTETMELFYMSCAVAEAGALARKKIVAYYGYGTMERKVLAGEAVKGKIRARLLSAIPACPLGNDVVLCDLHTEGIPYYMEGGLQPQHVYIAKHLVSSVAREMCGLPSSDVLGELPMALPENTLGIPTLTATDAGRHNWIKSIGREVGMKTAFGRKERTGPDKVEFVGVLGDVLKKNALEYDDKLGTGGTSVEAAGGIRLDQYGKELIDLARSEDSKKLEPALIPQVETVFVGTHGVFAGEALKKLQAKDLFGRPLITRVVVADTHPRSRMVADGTLIKIKTVALLLSQAVLD